MIVTIAEQFTSYPSDRERSPMIIWKPGFRVAHEDIKLAVHPIMPEKFRETEDSKVSLYDYPYSAAVVVVGIRKLLVTDYHLMKKC